jgi:hypothetical protein
MVKDSRAKTWFRLKTRIVIPPIIVSLIVLLLTMYVNDVFAQSESNDTLTQPNPMLPSLSAPSGSDVVQPSSPSTKDQNQQPRQMQLTIDDINPSTPQIDESTSVSGTVHVSDISNCCSVDVDWGDGSSHSTVHTTSSGSERKWTATHTYHIADTYDIRASVSEVDGAIAPAEERTIAILIPTTLTLDPINNVNPSQSITIKGFLKDYNNKGIGDQAITFDGTGVSDSQLTATSNNDGSGSFSVPITAPNTVSTDLEVKAHFAGNSDSDYGKSDSNTVFYSITTHSQVDPNNRNLTIPPSIILPKIPSLPDIKLPKISEPKIPVLGLDYKNNPDISQLPLWPIVIVAIAISVIAIAISKARGRHRHVSQGSSTEQKPYPHENTVVEIKTEGGLE